MKYSSTLHLPRVTSHALTLLSILAAASGCTVTTETGTPTTTATTTGNLVISWQIASTTDPAQCANEGAANVVLQLTDSLGTLYGGPSTAPCSAFSATVPDLPPGAYVVSGYMVNAQNQIISTTATGPAVVVNAGISSAESIDFPANAFTAPVAGTGTLVVDWTIASATDPAACATAGAATIVLQLSDVAGNREGGANVAACSSFTATVTGLATGSHELSAHMANASNQVVSTTVGPIPITVASGIATLQAFDFPLSSFSGPSTSETGSVAVTWDIASTTDPASCTAHHASYVLLQLYDAGGAPMGTVMAAPCTAFAATIPELQPGTYGVTAQMVDSNQQPVGTIVGPVEVTVVSGAPTPVPFDFPTTSFTN